VVEPVERDTRGILRPAEGLEHFRLERHQPSPDVGRFVDRYWIASWNLPTGEQHEQEVLVHPVVNVTFDERGATTGGVYRKRFVRTLEGHGRVLGVMFRPGGFRSFLQRAMNSITDKPLAFADVPGIDGVELEREMATALRDDMADEKLVVLADDALAAHVPPARQPSEETTELAELIARDRSIRRVDELADAAGLSVRQLQRRFADHVGVSPKWVIRRYRLYDAAEQAARTDDVDWAALAVDLGYADQAHLIRDFADAVGEAPQRYASRTAKLSDTTSAGS
jgi:AraC-like DNA-binding protein